MFVDLFFFKQKTAYEMRISDWSSDVCSSDLQEFLDLFGLFARAAEADVLQSDILEARDLVRQLFGQDLAQEIGEAVLGRADEIPGRGALEHGDVRRPLAVALFGHRRLDGDRGRARSDHDDLLARIIEILRPELRVEDRKSTRLNSSH